MINIFLISYAYLEGGVTTKSNPYSFFEAIGLFNFKTHSSIAWLVLKVKIPFLLRKKRILVGGPEQIRTAVGAFAELCLTTRLQDQLRITKVAILGNFTSFLSL